jgi:hypothetical protein
MGEPELTESESIRLDRNSPPHCRRSCIQPDPFSPRMTRSKKRSQVWNVQENRAFEEVLEEIAASLPVVSDSLPVQVGEDLLVEEDSPNEDASPPPELSHNLGPLGECGMSTWYHALNHPIGSVGSLPTSVSGAMAGFTQGIGGPVTATMNADVIDRTWFSGINETRKEMDVLVSAEYIRAVSYHTGQRFASTFGSIVREYWDSITGEHWIVCDLGTEETNVRVPATACRFPVRDAPSVGGTFNSSEGAPLKEVPIHGHFTEDNIEDWWEAGGDTELVGVETLVPRDVGGIQVDGPWMRQVQDFQEEFEDTQATRTLGSQDSNMRTPFPKVRSTLPEYLHTDSSDSDSTYSDCGSSGSDWLGLLDAKDFVDVDELQGDFDGEFDEESVPEDWDDTVEDWCVEGRFFEREYRARKFSTKEAFLQYYAEREWCSDHVRLLGSRDTFCGPTPGCTAPGVPGRVATPCDYWDLYWPDEILMPIVVETNRYARTMLPPRKRRMPLLGSNVASCSWAGDDTEEENVDIDGISDGDLGVDIHVDLEYEVDVNIFCGRVGSGSRIPRGPNSSSATSIEAA